MSDNDSPSLLSNERIAENREKILSLLRSTERPGMDRFLDWLDKTDFFGAPASTKYHLAVKGGLAEHSLNVYRLLSGKVEAGLLTIRPDSVIIASLLHDICKVNFYFLEKKNVREGSRINAYGSEVANWVEKEVWTVKDSFPVGHGDKSCYYIQSFIRLTEEEYAMIRLHMGPDKNSYPDPFAETANRFPAVVAIHTADIESAYILEARGC